MLEEKDARTHAETSLERSGMDPDRRAALLAIAKYSGAVGAAASLTVLSAEQAVACQPSSCGEEETINTSTLVRSPTPTFPPSERNFFDR